MRAVYLHGGTLFFTDLLTSATAASRLRLYCCLSRPGPVDEQLGRQTWNKKLQQTSLYLRSREYFVDEKELYPSVGKEIFCSGGQFLWHSETLLFAKC